MVVFQKVFLIDGVSDACSGPSEELICGNIIATISDTPISVDRRGDTVVIDRTRETLLPGLIEVSIHVMFMGSAQQQMLLEDFDFATIAPAKVDEDLLMRGFVTVRYLGGRSLD